MKTISKKIFLIYFILLVVLIFTTNCQPEEPKNNGLAISSDAVNADFTIDKSNAANNIFTFNANKENILANIWDLGDGTNAKNGGNSLSVFIPDAGTYTIQHTSIGRGGSSNVKSQTLVVETSDLISGNLIRGGKFQNAADHTQWTILNIAGSHINWTFGNGFANVSGSSPTQYAQQGIYQAVQVIANQEYKIDMKVTGNPCLNAWFEVYVGTAAPVQNNDYSSGGKRISIKTFDNCVMANAFDGKLSVLNCDGTGNKFKFLTSGTVYIVIRSGGFGNNTLGSGGVKMTDVEFRRVK